ncbi:MAG: M2 family metallopeptidase [Acidobacteria bacterium]|nr:M2 family metallopeptidase [Acidobacteriota bacterium]
MGPERNRLHLRAAEIDADTHAASPRAPSDPRKQPTALRCSSRPRQDRRPAVRAVDRSTALEGVRGESAPAHSNQAWCDLRLRYQGIAPPSPRGGQFFDPGAKYHAPDNTPYTRYFLAGILQFQFHRALLGHRPHDAAAPCSIYRSGGGRAAVSRRCCRWARRAHGPMRSTC